MAAQGTRPSIAHRANGVPATAEALGPHIAVSRHPLTQVVLLGVVCFMCPGSFNALNGLGAGGQVDSTASANSNTALYATFAISAFFAGSIQNQIGPRLTLSLGSMGYALYIISYIVIYVHPGASAFVTASGAILGICAALLWTAQGSLMLAYPTEPQKGQYIGVFWSIFSLGSVVGAAVSLARNFHSEANSVGIDTYIGFLVLTIVGVVMSLLLVNPSRMIRTDGRRVVTSCQPSWKSELRSLWATTCTDPSILLLFPFFVASNWFYTWQFNNYNGAIFNIRTRALNNLVYWIAQIFGSVSISLLFDQQCIRRRVRAFAGWLVVFIMTFIVHTWALFYQRQYTRENILPEAERMDMYDDEYMSHVWLYIFCAILDAMWQTMAYWLMGALSNDTAKLAHFNGFYKSLQSAGAAVVWHADAQKAPYMNIFISNWVLLAVGLTFALPMIYLRLKDITETVGGVPAQEKSDHGLEVSR